MIFPPTVGPLWGSEIQPELRSWRESSGEQYNLSETSRQNDSSLRLVSTAGAEILEGDVWGALQIEHAVAGTMIVPPTVGPLWSSEIQPEM